MRLAYLVALTLAVAGCKKSAPPARMLELTGYTTEGKGLDLSTLRGKPWVINIWRPG
jgi:hypothetical protein